MGNMGFKIVLGYTSYSGNGGSSIWLQGAL